MKILTLEAYYGGSHKAFLDGWTEHSQHDFTLLTLPPSKWKWRMRHAAITFAQQVNELLSKSSGGTVKRSLAVEKPWDILFCSDMLNLAEFLGLANESIRQLPKVVYFHENQLTYPVQVESERDYQYCMTNITTATAADAVWFNSAFHQDEFLEAIGVFLKRMPDYQPTEVIEQIHAKSSIHPPGINPIEHAKERKPGPVRILWAARWEHDKNPEDFFAAVKTLKEKGLNFRLNVIGEQFRDRPEVFDWAKEYFADHIDRWGYQPTKEEYAAALAESDIVVSTANHEFFGIGMLEAIAAGCYPLLPQRLSYPTIIRSLVKDSGECEVFLYDGTVKGLATRLERMVSIQTYQAQHPSDNIDGLRTIAEFAIPAERLNQYYWPQRAKEMDKALSS
ncbi:MAG: tRNA-queuosine alpha-mannosyltransferase domain-containing protein [Planctomycetota bacterium]|jgi:glycosyltransferase involved in cell wall biosynthesis